MVGVHLVSMVGRWIEIVAWIRWRGKCVRHVHEVRERSRHHHRGRRWREGLMRGWEVIEGCIRRCTPIVTGIGIVSGCGDEGKIVRVCRTHWRCIGVAFTFTPFGSTILKPDLIRNRARVLRGHRIQSILATKKRKCLQMKTSLRSPITINGMFQFSGDERRYGDHRKMCCYQQRMIAFRLPMHSWRMISTPLFHLSIEQRQRRSSSKVLVPYLNTCFGEVATSC